MAAGSINRIVGQLRRVTLSDAQLLDRFIAHRDPAAFELLLRLHGPMVLGVCRRLLGNHADAEDAFQATFLVLVRRAASIVPREQVGNWLYGVAYRTALKARAMNAKRRTRERQASPRAAVSGSEESWPELQAILDEELERLPAKYRAPVVLCDLEGKTHREAARLLGWPDGTLSTRLIAARRLLAGRLTRRGVTLAAGAIAALVAQHAAPAAVPAALAATTMAAAVGTTISTQVALLTEGVLKAMLIAKLKTTACVVAGLLLLGVVAGGFAYPGAGHGGEEGAQAKASVARDGDAAQQSERKGTVTRVSETDLVQISLGTDDGIAKGDRVIIYRLQPKPYFLGRATVVEAQPRQSVVSLPASKARVQVGDQVVKDDLVPPGKAPPPAEQLGVVSRIDAGNNVLEVSLGSDDGIKEGQMLHVWHLAPKTAYFGKIKVIATFQRSAVARPTDAAILKAITAGDKVSVHPPTWPSEPKEAPSQPRPTGEPPQPNAPKHLSARQVAERVLVGAVKQKIGDVRDLMELTVLSTTDIARIADAKLIKVPSLTLVEVASDNALAISNDVPFGRRIVIQLNRAAPEGVPSGRLTGAWRVTAFHIRESGFALDELLGFLNRHPNARAEPAETALDAGRK